ncbi:hypothetical protein CLIM01_06873 [Colletotrichum limetticola]|uniref:Secreted protein n=1 Tax=Colletotrichum limetticola TaxID=1209924 RepID=A0ABQ9PWF2_9PEZI|nr:hypothetical protein CLIM01_06873 [Colletotrichum limetticola]
MRLKQAVPAALGLRVLVQVSVGKVAKGFLQGQVGCWTRQKEVEVAGSGYTEWESRVGGGSIIVPLLDCRCIFAGTDWGVVYADCCPCENERRTRKCVWTQR